METKNIDLNKAPSTHNGELWDTNYGFKCTKKKQAFPVSCTFNSSLSQGSRSYEPMCLEEMEILES